MKNQGNMTSPKTRNSFIIELSDSELVEKPDTESKDLL
jgi:hypothetical protein